MLTGNINWEEAVDDFVSSLGAGSELNSVPECCPASKVQGIEMGSFSLDFQVCSGLRRAPLVSVKNI